MGPHGRPVRARRACDGRRPRTRAHRRARRARGGAGLMRRGPGARAKSRPGGAEKRPPGPERESRRDDMGLRRGKPPEAVYELSDEQVERWREGDETVWAERKPGLVDRLTMPGVEVIRDPRLL